MRPLKNYIKYYIASLFVLIILCSSTIADSQPVANFTAAPTTGCAPLQVQFSDLSTGNPTSWNWDLGNGTISSQKNPVTTYINAGTYTIKLTAGNAAGTNSITKTQYITVYDKPAVRFTVSDSSNCVPFVTNFKDLSTASSGTITAWQWDFDDGNTSALQNPAHLYNQPGNYNITLKVTNSGGCFSSLSKLAYIKAADSIRTQFNFSQPLKCKPPETVTFTNNTLGPGTLTYAWNFGDGTSSATTSPTHTYLTSGLYSITLIAKNNLGCRDTMMYKDTLLIKNVHSAINSADTACAFNRIPFINSTTPAPLSSKWLFSDGTAAFGASTAKTWAAPGTYQVKLVSNFNTCSDSVIKTITVLAAPVVNFSASDSTSCKASLTVNFTDLSTGGAIRWNWDFGDGYTASLQHPTHTYSSEGEFTVKLTATNAGGCSAPLTQYRFIRILKPVAAFDSAEDGGCIPYTFKPYNTASSVDGITNYWWDFGNGHTSSNRFPVEVYTDSGTYTVKLTVTSTDGCVDSTVRINAVRTGNHPAVNFGLSPTVVCPGTSIQFTDSSAPADKWRWIFGDGNTSDVQNPSHQFYDSGKYSIKLIAWNNGCKDSISKLRALTILPGLARFRPVYNCANKKEIYFKDSSILPQSWFWDFGDGNTSTQQNPTHQFANYQTYNVSLTTTNDSCTNTKTITVQPIDEVPDFSISKNKLCISDSVIFYLQHFNKQNITRYNWDFGDGTIDSVSTDSVHHTYTKAGVYSVKLVATDIYQCSETTVKTNAVHVFGPHAGFTINAAGGCRNKALNFTDTSNIRTTDHNIAQWFWDFGDGYTQVFSAPLPATVPHIYTSSGYFYPSLKIIDSTGCSDSVSYSSPVRINQPVASFFSPNYNTCMNDSVIFRNPSTGKNLVYQWSFGDGSFSSDSLPVKQYATNGDFSMKLLVTDIFGCKDSMTRNNYIKVRSVAASFSVNDSVGTCTPFQVNFTNNSTNALSQVWDFGDGGFSSTANPVYHYASPGIYYAKLTAKRSNGCYKTDSLKIKITAPAATLNYVPQTGCAPLNVSFLVSTKDTVSFIWDFNDGSSAMSTDSTIIHSYRMAGNFIPSVILKDSAGCIVPVIGKDTIKIYSSNVNFAADDSSFCEHGLVKFSDSSFSGSHISGYQWELGDGAVSTQQNPTHYYTGPGQYPVKLIVSTITGCRDSLVKTNYIKVFTTPQVSITGNNTSYCGPSFITMQGNLFSIDTSAVNWNWNFDNGNTSLLQNPAAQPYTDTGKYTIQLVATSNNGCADTTGTNIIINPVPNTFAGNDTVICAGTTAALHAGGADSYSWQPAAFLSCTNCANPVTNIQNDGSYYVKGTNRYGCEKTDTVSIAVKHPFHITGLKANDSICAGKTIQLNISGAEKYKWAPATGLSNAAIHDPVASPGSSTIYKVIGSDSIHCFKDSASIFIKVNPAPTVSAGNDLLINYGRSVTLTPQYSSDIVNWLWQPSAGLSCSNCASPVASPANSSTYSIEVTNGSGCTATDEVFVQVTCNKKSIFLPTAFSPNNDQWNDYFFPLNPPGMGSIRISAFNIYNRYGQLVFQNSDFYSNDKTKGWDGRCNGRECPVGSYTYTISFTCAGKQELAFNGNILLIR